MSLKEKVLGGLLGVAIGDALGVPVEFQPRYRLQKTPVSEMIGYGTHNQPAGTWSDDSSLTFCLAQSLCEKGFDLKDAGERFVKWYRKGYWTPHGNVFDVGITTAEAIRRLEAGVKPDQAGPNDEKSNGNGSLMRILPAAIYFLNDTDQVMSSAVCSISRLTHGHPRSQLGCVLYCLLAKELLKNKNLPEAYAKSMEKAPALCKGTALQNELQYYERILGGKLPSLPETEIKSGGYVVDTLEASIWRLLNFDSFSETVLAAVNLGGDTDTTGAVAGGLAGLYYGYDSLPVRWLNKLARCGEILDLGENLFNKIRQYPAPFPRSYWVIPGKFLAGCYPGDKNPVKARLKLEGLIDSGIRCIINLMQEDETDHDHKPFESYNPLLNEIAGTKGVKVFCARWPVRDTSVPKRKIMQSILDKIDDEIKIGRPVYVHCWGGRGRTGTVVGCHLARQGDKDPLGTIKELRANDPTATYPSPETDKQREMVRSWVK